MFLIDGFTRARYDPLRHPISSLAIGQRGWIQVLNFIMVGLSVVAFAFGLAYTRRDRKALLAAALCLAAAGVGLIGAGVFVTDAVFGYPSEAPLALEQFSDRGRLHSAFSRWFFRGIPLAAFIFCYEFARQGKQRWAVYSAASGLGMIAVIILSGLGFNRTLDLAMVAGLLQRSSIIIGLLWVTLLAAHLLHRVP